MGNENGGNLDRENRKISSLEKEIAQNKRNVCQPIVDILIGNKKTLGRVVSSTNNKHNAKISKFSRTNFFRIIY